jgi:hypothetical protein
VDLKPRDYELFVRGVMQGLLAAQGITVAVEHDKKIVGLSGQEHQIDVYWEGVLPRRPWRADDLLEPESGDGLSDEGVEDAISVAVKEAQGRVKREAVEQLPPCPLRGGMLGDVDVADAAPAVIQDKEAVEDSEGGGGDGEEVDSGRCAEVVGKERPPGLRGRALSTGRHVPGDGGLAHGES